MKVLRSNNNKNCSRRTLQWKSRPNNNNNNKKINLILILMVLKMRIQEKDEVDEE
ncbi:hypothetical protein A2U01_0101280 [Trifolium medium]|uniref:Uncharacterized protein n=1 Tax=Trifolium medium TaxID=97028 RepID=A0A392UYE4_9FABA|nr:hypothetical protein [Trifolium medium]